jgi:hypothetical protein
MSMSAKHQFMNQFSFLIKCVQFYRDEHGKEYQGKAAYNAYKGLKSNERKGPRRRTKGKK